MPADPKTSHADAREKLIGLGKRSISKSYYPELRKRLEELEHFRALLDRVSDAIFVVDAESGELIDVSGSTRSMLGCGARDIVGTEFKRLLPDHIRRHADNLFHADNRKLRLETELICPESGRSVPVDISLQIVTHQDKRQPSSWPATSASARAARKRSRRATTSWRSG